MRARYNKITIVNLVNQKGNEKELADEYKNQWQAYNDDNIHYVDFDFHNETRKMRYHNISKLVTAVEKNLQEYGFFWADINSNKIMKKQEGVIRVNCIDCLDRTNVVESVFAKIFLVEKLQEMKLLTPKETLTEKPAFDQVFKHVWADNGDVLSTIYSGTGALKGDFTRTGKRSVKGYWDDFCNSATRYYLNNFRDGKTQDAMNLVLGKYVVDHSAESPFKSRGSLKTIYIALFIAFFFSVFMLVTNLFKLPTDSEFKYRCMSVFLWFISTFAVYKLLIRNGRDIVSNPVLKSKTNKKVV
jgi:hypothetical protein